MMHMNLRNVAIATSTFACAALFSFGWSEQGGVSLSIEGAQARVGRPLTPMSVAGVHRRQMRRAGYGYGAGVVGAGLAAGAVGTAAVAAATSPLGWGGGPYVGSGYYGRPYVGTGALAARRAYYGGGPYVGTGYYGGRLAARAAYYGGGPGYYSAGDTCATGVGCAGVGTGYYTGPLAANAAYTGAFHTDDAPFYIPRAYHADGPWMGYAGWADYKARNGISCDPGTLTKMSDGLQYVCQ